jgi:uncharacterized membrane protein YgcG
MRRVKLRFLVLAVSVLMACTLACVVAPVRAYAVDFDIDAVTIAASVAADGTLTVTEDRTFYFDDSANGVYWDIATGDYQGRNVEATVLAAGVVTGDVEKNNGTAALLAEVTGTPTNSESMSLLTGDWATFSQVGVGNAATGERGVYTVEAGSDATRVTLYNPVGEGAVTYRVVYTLSNMLTAYSDVAELYWDFVGTGWSVASQNVNLVLVLPAPEGAMDGATDATGSEAAGVGGAITSGATLGDVRAWGHGSLEGTVALDGATVLVEVPKVAAGDYAEVRVAFPVGWTTLEPSATAGLPSILEEETAWANEANTQRVVARLAVWGVTLACVALPVACALLVWRASKRFRALHTPPVQETYWRDVPAPGVHPAATACFYRHASQIDGPMASSSLLRLCDLGACALVEEGGAFAVAQVPGSAAVAALDAVDTAMYQLLFDCVWPATGKKTTAAGAPMVRLKDMKRATKRDAQAYSDAFDEVNASVQAAIVEAGWTCDTRPRPTATAVVSLVVGILAATAAIMVLGVAFEAVVQMIIALAASVAAILAGVAGISGFYDATPQGDLVLDRTAAFIRWVNDFTRLNEVPPTDVILWNRILVQACALGVADKVIELLRTQLPQVAEDPLMEGVWLWYVWGPGGGPGGKPPIDVAAGAYTSSFSAVAASMDSSGSGFGGGFSGGGGGGFGGSSGGGAF